MDFVTNIAPSDLFGIRLIAESNQFAIYATGLDCYLLVQRHAAVPWTGVLLSGDAVFRVSGLLGEATRDLYREVAALRSPVHREAPHFESRVIDAAVFFEKADTACESRDLYEDDLTEERQISPVARDKVAATLVFDPFEGNEETGEPLTRAGGTSQRES